MSSKYAIWLNYDNDRLQFRIPVNPEAIKTVTNGKITTSEIEKLGTLIHKGRRDAVTISWSGYFPKIYSETYCSCEQKQFKAPKKMHSWILSLMEAKDPVHLVVSGCVMGLNIYACITKYTAQEEGGDPGTISYTIEMKEYRSVTIKKYKKTVSKKSKKMLTTTSKKRVSNKQTPKTYTIKSGDCLWNIAKKCYGNGAQYTKILNANRSTLDAAAKKHGHSSCNNGNLIFAGTKIKIP